MQSTVCLIVCCGNQSDVFQILVYQLGDKQENIFCIFIISLKPFQILPQIGSYLRIKSFLNRLIVSSPIHEKPEDRSLETADYSRFPI